MKKRFYKYTVMFLACFCLVASPVTLAVTGTGTGTPIGADTSDPNLGGGQIGNGMGTSTGDSYIDSNGGGCPNTRLISEKLISATCWTCLFPIFTLGIYLGASSGEAPSGHYSAPICICKDSNGLPYLGFTYGLWQPSKAAEFVRIPGCAATLNGIELGFSTLDEGEWNNLGEIGTGEGQFDGDFTNEMASTSAVYHYYSYPLLIVLEMFQSSLCTKDRYLDIDMIYLSEVDPTWTSDLIAFFTNPEAVLFGNPVAVLACAADGVASSLFKRPIESLFWCAGSWGVMYPLTRNVGGVHGGVPNSSLMLAKTLLALHRRGFLQTTYGKDSICEGNYVLHLPKNQYKFTMIYPVPQIKTAQVIGEATIKWESAREVPVTGEDFVYLIWTWNDCCMSFFYGADT